MKKMFIVIFAILMCFNIVIEAQNTNRLDQKTYRSAESMLRQVIDDTTQALRVSHVKDTQSTFTQLHPRNNRTIEQILLALIDASTNSLRINDLDNNYVDLTGVADSSMLVVEDGELVAKTKAQIKTILGIGGSYPSITDDGTTLSLDADTIKINGIKQPKIYRALLTQTGTNAPTAIVLENTIGNIVWSRNSVGYYQGTLTNAFTENKTFVSITHNKIYGSPFGNFAINRETSSVVGVEITSISENGGADEMMTKTPVEIIVYP